MTIDELAKKLGLEGEKVEALKIFVAAKDSEIATKTSEIKTLKTAAKGHAEQLKKVEEKAEKVFDALGVDADTDDIEDAIKVALKGKSTDPVLQKQIDKLKSKIKDQETEFTKQLSGEKSKRYDGMKQAALMKALADNKIEDVDLIAKMLLPNLTINEDDETLAFSDDKHPKIDDFVKEFARTHPKLVANNQKSGADSLNLSGSMNTGNDTDFAKNLAEERNARSNEATTKALDNYMV